MEITHLGGRIALTVTLSVAEFARALADGELRLVLPGATPAAEGALAPAEREAIARVCRAYGPESLGANLIWEIAQAGEAGIGASALREPLGLATPKQLAGVFSGLGKVLAREMPGARDAFVERTWQARAAEYHYRMGAAVRAAVLAELG